ncbi:hypothetical protein [Psychroserpens sp. SPM9]|uniref:hypothetical protein n=1 Tax=Psychroserpens sp. SPM9 TaxID=2975598 RepID=UPI0021A70E34|nr:hypothetical protein [Psychroserpens sp. SPM9]MDG5490393.1 hypothetical protein [Psychroserpens sp. SPM9]
MNIKKYDKVLLFFFVAAIAASSLIWLFDERFHQENWHSNPAKRYQMADDIIDNELLIGKTKNEVIALLGTPEIFNDDSKNYIIYKMGKAPSFKDYIGDRLVVVFEEGKVAKVIHSKE